MSIRKSEESDEILYRTVHKLEGKSTKGKGSIHLKCEIFKLKKIRADIMTNGIDTFADSTGRRSERDTVHDGDLSLFLQ